MAPSDLAVLAVSSAAACTDVRYGRIPNVLPAVLCVAGVIVTAHEGIFGLLAFAGVLVLVLIAGTFLHACRLLGGGDVKLLAASCATLGVHEIPVFLFATLLAGGVFGLTIAALRGRLSATVTNISTIALPMFAGVRPTPPLGGTKMPYALAIFAGALTTALLHFAR